MKRIAALLVAGVVVGSLVGCKPPPPKVVAVQMGGNTDCALMSDHTVRCWGGNQHGVLGNNTTVASAAAVPIGGLTKVSALAVGDSHACAIVSGGSVKCWGYNLEGQLGNGTFANSPVPVSVPGITGATAITAGAFSTCVLVAGGQGRCWGDDTWGGLGDGKMSSYSPSPEVVVGLTGATAISAGTNHTCALMAGGSIRCWGQNHYSQLGADGDPRPGTGDHDDSSIPITVPRVSGAVGLALGNFHSCARIANASVVCWGSGTSGELGNGVPLNSVDPVTVVGLPGATTLSVGGGHGCSAVTGGTLRCWGTNNHLELGSGSTATDQEAVAVQGVSAGAKVFAGIGNSCALLTSGVVTCWGWDNTTSFDILRGTLRPTPVPIAGL